MSNQLAAEEARPALDAILRDLPMTPAVSASPMAAPWLVTIHWECLERGWVDQYTAVGVLVGRNHVLTVAHLNDMRHPIPEGLEHKPTFDERHFFVRTGRDDGNQRYEIAGWLKGAYAPVGIEGVTRVDNRVNDVVLLVLDKPTSVAPIRLADAAPAVGTPVSIFGRLEDQDDTAQVDTVVIDPVAGESGQLGADELVVANVADGDVRLGTGFSGAPVVVTDSEELVGVLNRGAYGLGDDYPVPGIVADVAVAHRKLVEDALH